MVSVVKKSAKNQFLWGLVVLLILGGMLGHYYVAPQSLILRLAGGLAIAVAAIFAALQTSQGQWFWRLWLEAVQEVRKIYWPTRRETMQTTLAVLAMVLVLGLLLWTADFILIRSIAWLTGHWGV